MEEATISYKRDLTVLLLSIIPYLLLVAGVDLGNDISDDIIKRFFHENVNADEMKSILLGTTIHFLMEFSCFLLATGVFVTSIINYQLSKNVRTLLLGVLMLCSGVLDLFHALASVYIIVGNTPQELLISNSWSVGMLIRSTIWCVCMLSVVSNAEWIKNKKYSVTILCGIVSMVIGYVILSVTSISLPQVSFPQKCIIRPLDLLAACMMLCVIIYTYSSVKITKRARYTAFSTYVFLTLFPSTATALHMALGADVVYNGHFNMAHSLKLFVYVLISIGAALDYSHTAKLLLKTKEDLKNNVHNLEKSNAELEQFAYIASHDLQEPLRMVVSYLTLIKTKYKDKLDTKGVEFLDIAVDGANRMRDLIKDILSLSRITSKGVKLSSIYMADIVNNVNKTLEVLVSESNAKVTLVEMPKTVTADGRQLEQLLCNLISNAIKFNDREPIVNVYVKSSLDVEDMWEFSVEDNGIGITFKNSRTIFQAFKRLHTQREYSGTGIGLSVCEKIVRRHGGDIWLVEEPSSLGGCHFKFNFPK